MFNSLEFSEGMLALARTAPKPWGTSQAPIGKAG